MNNPGYNQKAFITLFKNILFLVLLLCIAVFSIALLPHDLSLWHHRGDFGHYYASAIRLQTGANPYEGTLEDILVANDFPLNNVEWRATNPPALILVTVPVAFFSPTTAFWLWNLLQVGVFAVGAYYFFRRLKIFGDKKLTGWSLAALVVSYPFLLHLRLGQSQLLLCGLIMLGLSLLESRTKLAAFVLGMCASLKLFTLPLGLVVVRYAMTREKAQKLHWLLFPIGFLALPTIAELWCQGFIHESYVRDVIPFVRLLQFEITMGTSLAFLLFFLTWAFIYKFDAPTNLPHLIGSTINSIVVGVFLVLLVVENLINRKPFHPLTSGLFCLTACVLCSPVAWPHYFVLLFPALLFIWQQISETGELKKLLFVLLYVATALTTGFHHVLPYATAFWGPAVLLSVLGTLLAIDRSRRK